MSTVTRRRTSREEEPKASEDRPTRRRRTSDDTPDEERNSSRRGRRSESSEEDRPRRGRRSESNEESPRRRRGTGGFAAYSEKKRSTSDYADEFKPADNTKTLIKILDAEPFDVYNQHWIEEGNASGKTRHSFVCRDDDYFEDEDGCPLCDIGDNAATFTLFNVLDLSVPRKPEVKVWKASPAVTDKLERASRDSKTSPLDREDLYFEIEKVKKPKKTEWNLLPVKARDLAEDFDLDPLEEDEIAEFAEGRFTDRTSVTKVDSYEELQELADSLD